MKKTLFERRILRLENTLLKRVLALLGLIVFAAGLVLVPIALYADSLYREAFNARESKTRQENAEVTSFDLFAEENAHQTQSRIAGWLSTVSSQEVTVSSSRAKLSATQYEPVGGDTNAPWAIVFHGGLGTDREQVMDIACMLSLQGYRVLTPDLYAHGKSEGAASTLGYGDAQDVRAWIDYVQKTQMGARIVLFGQDEGAAAVLMAACDGLGESVAAVAADSACDDGVSGLLALAGMQEGDINAFLFELMFKRKTGFDGAKLSERIAQADVPLLLIHGTGDQVVPAWHSEDIALAAGDSAQLLYVEGAGHGLSRFLEPQTVYDALLAFYENALK